jgi:cysteine desulfuration protein SufE
MAEIKEIAEQIISEFEMLDDWMDKYNYLIELGKSVPLIDPKYKTKNNLISGCQSRVWLHAGYDDGLIKFSADSDAVITKGIVSLLIRVLNNQRPDDILNADLDFVNKIGLRDHLSPTRSNGLNSMIKQIKLYAMAYKARELGKQ